MKKSILLIAIILVSACAVKTIPVKVVLQSPAPLELPRMSATELSCLSDDVYTRLVTRDTMQSERIKTLRGIIESTQK